MARRRWLLWAGPACLHGEDVLPLLRAVVAMERRVGRRKQCRVQRCAASVSLAVLDNVKLHLGRDRGDLRQES